jgi:ribonuclease HI
VIVVTAWYIWWLRRRLTHDEQIPPVYQCINSIIKAITANVAKGKSRSSSHKITWSKPLASAVKLNIDAAFDVERKSGASGAIIRNNQGNFIAASSVFIPYVASATMTEAMAMLHGLNFANSLGYSEVEAESDSLEVVQLCSGEDRIWNGSIAIYANIIDQAGGIGKVEFKHCRRKANKIAHDIARNCFNSTNSCTWVDEPPSFILQLLLDDVTVL